jgi:hypothetical protein
VVDFNYGGRIGDVGTVYLHQKRGDRSALLPAIRSQFDAAGTEPSEGLPVVLTEPRADLDDGGTVCDLVVSGTLTQMEGRWAARYPWGGVTWVPSDSD